MKFGLESRSSKRRQKSKVAEKIRKEGRRDCTEEEEWIKRVGASG